MHNLITQLPTYINLYKKVYIKENNNIQLNKNTFKYNGNKIFEFVNNYIKIIHKDL